MDRRRRIGRSKFEMNTFTQSNFTRLRAAQLPRCRKRRHLDISFRAT